MRQTTERSENDDDDAAPSTHYLSLIVLKWNEDCCRNQQIIVSVWIQWDFVWWKFCSNHLVAVTERKWVDFLWVLVILLT